MTIKTSFAGLVFAVSACISGHAMDFGWGSRDVKPNENRDNVREAVWMIGDIRSGDYEKFREFLSKNFDDYVASARTVYVSSNGGDIIESMRLAVLLKAMYASVYVHYQQQCLSSCFMLYIGGVQRSATLGKLGIHRAYFDPKYFTGLTPAQAEKEQARLTALVKRYLEDRFVPSSTIEKMIGTPSNEVHWMDSSEVVALGRYPLWYEEMLIARCNYMGSRKLTSLMLRDFQKWSAEIDRVNECEAGFVTPLMKTALRSQLEAPVPFTVGRP